MWESMFSKESDLFWWEYKSRDVQQEQNALESGVMWHNMRAFLHYYIHISPMLILSLDDDIYNNYNGNDSYDNNLIMMTVIPKITTM